MDEKPSETLPTVVPANQLPVAPPVDKISPSGLAKLAHEIAMDIKELPDILAFYKLTPAEYEAIQKNPFFKNALETAVVEWNGSLNTHERIKIEAAAILEEGMPALAARMRNKDEPFPAAVEAGKLFAKISGIGEEGRGNAAPGEKFTISINLGSDTKLHFEKDVTPSPDGGISRDQKKILEIVAPSPSRESPRIFPTRESQKPGKSTGTNPESNAEIPNDGERAKNSTPV